MADYIVKDTELTSVANAIRTAGGTSSLLTFPNGFTNAINNISGGGGSSDFSTAMMTISGFPTGLGGGLSMNYLIYVEGGEIMTIAEVSAVQNGTYEVVIYKGTGYAEVGEESGWAISGDATEDGGEITYTGDFTISAA